MVKKTLNEYVIEQNELSKKKLGTYRDFCTKCGKITDHVLDDNGYYTCQECGHTTGGEMSKKKLEKWIWFACDDCGKSWTTKSKSKGIPDVCPYCGSKNIEGTEFSLSKKKMGKGYECPYCGGFNVIWKEDEFFCPDCKKGMAIPANMSKKKMGVITPDTCPKCGAKIKFYDGALGYEAIICPKCGWFADQDGEGQHSGYIGMKKKTLEKVPMECPNCGNTWKRDKEAGEGDLCPKCHNQGIMSLSKKELSGITCPYCGSTRLIIGDVSGMYMCEDCGKQFPSGKAIAGIGSLKKKKTLLQYVREQKRRESL